MFFWLSKLLDVFLSPFTWGLGLLALAIPWRAAGLGARPPRKRALGVMGLGILVAFSLEPVAEGLLFSLEHQTKSTYRPDVTYDAVILLGGVLSETVTEESGQPALHDTVERLVETHRLLMEGHARNVIISAAIESPAHADSSETRVLRGQLVLWGINPARIVLEEQARNTYENALYSKQLASDYGFRKVLVVTSAFHMKRARECFDAVGMDVDTLLVDFRARKSSELSARSWLPRASHLSTSTDVLREMAGLYIYRLRGYARAPN